MNLYDSEMEEGGKNDDHDVMTEEDDEKNGVHCPDIQLLPLPEET